MKSDGIREMLADCFFEKHRKEYPTLESYMHGENEFVEKRHQIFEKITTTHKDVDIGRLIEYLKSDNINFSVIKIGGVEYILEG